MGADENDIHPSESQYRYERQIADARLERERQAFPYQVQPQPMTAEFTRSHSPMQDQAGSPNKDLYHNIRGGLSGIIIPVDDVPDPSESYTYPLNVQNSSRSMKIQPYSSPKIPENDIFEFINWDPDMEKDQGMPPQAHEQNAGVCVCDDGLSYGNGFLKMRWKGLMSL